jgi:hypothetical protein
MMYNYCFFHVKHFEKFDFFDVVNSDIFMQIFEHSTVQLDLKNLLKLKQFKDFERRKLLNLTFLNIQS